MSRRYFERGTDYVPPVGTEQVIRNRIMAGAAGQTLP